MKQETASATTPEPRKRPSRVHSAKEKSQAVLALWSGRRSASTLIKELGVPWAILNTWEKRALTGMLTALDPMWKQPEEAQNRLPNRLERLMEQAQRPAPASEPATSH